MKSLREHRRLHLMSIHALAKKAGVSTKTILDAEKGRTTPSFRTMARVSQALGVPPEEIAEFAASIAEK